MGLSIFQADLLPVQGEFEILRAVVQYYAVFLYIDDRVGADLVAICDNGAANHRL
jgi:hypothetical protein